MNILIFIELADYETKNNKKINIPSLLAFKNFLDRSVTDAELKDYENKSLIKTHKSRP